MKLHKVIWQRYDSNSYILEINNTVIIIDSNCELYPYLITNNIVPDYLFLTHEHFDHIEGINKIKESFSNIKVYATKSASELFSDEKSNMSFFFEGQNVSEAQADIEITENKTFNIADKNITCFLTPGHTDGCMIIQIDNLLFTGDTVLNNVKTPKNTPNSSKEKLVKSLDFIESFFNDETIIYPGHGEMFYKKDWNKATSLGKIIRNK